MRLAFRARGAVRRVAAPSGRRLTPQTQGGGPKDEAPINEDVSIRVHAPRLGRDELGINKPRVVGVEVVTPRVPMLDSLV